MSTPETAHWQAEFDVDGEVVHPWYGQCDGLMDDGGCAECCNVRFVPFYAEAARAWWVVEKEGWGKRAATRAAKKARRKAMIATNDQ